MKKLKGIGKALNGYKCIRRKIHRHTKEQSEMAVFTKI